MKKKLLLKAPILSQSGYGEHSRFIYKALKQQEEHFDIYIEPLNWGRTGWIWEDTEERREIDTCIGKFYQILQSQTPNYFDIGVVVDLPTAWKRFAPFMVGVTAGVECDAVAPTWLQPTLDQVDQVIVPSKFSKEGFLNAIDKYGHVFDEDTRNQIPRLKEMVDDKITVVNYPVKQYEKEELNLQFETDFNFLLVAQWGPRKNIQETVESFYQEFYNDDNVGLVIKTSIARNSVPDRFHTMKRLREIRDNYSEAKCKIYLLHGEMTENQMHSIYHHPQIKAMVNFGRGEGYGLPLFEAAYCGLPVITHNFGGQTDFLYANKKDKKGKIKSRAFFSKVPYKQLPVDTSAVWKDVIEPDAEWAFTNMAAAKVIMRDVYKNHDFSLGTAKKLKKQLIENFSIDSKNKEVVKVILGQDTFDYDTVSVEDLPKISFITSMYNGEEHFEGFMEDITGQTIFEEKCELVLLNCNSEQNEDEMIKPWLEKYPNNIKYIKLDEDPGIYAAWNLAIKESSGDFLSNANLDDRKSNTFAEKMAKILYANEDVDCVYSENYVTNRPNETFDNNSSNGQVYPAPEFSKQEMLRGNAPHCMPMWRKSLHEQFGYFKEDFKSASDWEFWLRCAYGGSLFKKVRDRLGLYYFNPKGISSNPEGTWSKMQEEKHVFLKYKNISETGENLEIVL